MVTDIFGTLKMNRFVFKSRERVSNEGDVNSDGKRCSLLSVFVLSWQRVKPWQTRCSTPSGLWAADPT